MPRSNRLVWRIAALAFLILPPAVAQWRSDSDAETCVTGTGIRNLDIAVCGRALARHDLGEIDRASVHVARGKALRDAGRLSAAIADFDAALSRNPYSATAYHERALARDHGGHFERALEDFQSALELSPRFWTAYRNRGIAFFYAGFPTCARADLNAAAALSPYDGNVYAFRGFLEYMQGHYQDAVDDFARVEALGMPYPYLPFWIYLSRTMTGVPADGVLVDADADLMPEEWPGALLAVYRGGHDGETMIAALENGEAVSTRRRRLAEAHFYLAALEQVEHRAQTEHAHLEHAVALAEYRMPERVLAENALAPRRPGPPGGCPSA